MLASLLLNLAGGAATATFATGGRIRVVAHAPTVGTEYLPGQEQWAAPQGRAPNRTLDVVLDRAAVAHVRRAHRARPTTRVSASGQWHATARAARAKVTVATHCASPTTGVMASTGAAKVTVAGHAPSVLAGWSVVASFGARRLAEPGSRTVRASAGAVAKFSLAYAVYAMARPPTARAVRNPSPAEIVAMVYAARKR